MPRHDRAHGQWHTTRQKRYRQGPGRATGQQSTTGSAVERSGAGKTVDVDALLAYVREQDKRKRVNGG